MSYKSDVLVNRGGLVSMILAALIQCMGVGLYSEVHECETSRIWKDEIFGQRW